jgi:hypothetical protein
MLPDGQGFPAGHIPLVRTDITVAGQRRILTGLPQGLFGTSAPWHAQDPCVKPVPAVVGSRYER